MKAFLIACSLSLSINDDDHQKAACALSSPARNVYAIVIHNYLHIHEIKWRYPNDIFIKMGNAH